MDVTTMIAACRIHALYPAVRELFLRFGGCTLNVVVSDGLIADRLNQYFSPFVAPSGPADIVISVHQAPDFSLNESFAVKQPDPGKTKIKEEFVELDDGRVVKKRLTGMFFIFGRRDNIAVGPCLDNLNQVVNFINNRYIEWLLCRGALLGHAAGVTMGGRGLAIAGFSGAGKSTLALRLMEKGVLFVSNDRLMVEKNSHGLTMHGVAKLPRINPGTALNSRALRHLIPEAEKAEWAGLSRRELWQVEKKYDVPIDKCFGAERFVLSARMNGLVILNWKPGEGRAAVKNVLDADHRKSLLAAFIKSAGLFFYPGNGCGMPVPSVDNYVRLLSGTDMWEFSGIADFDMAADRCLSFLYGRG